jgi:hypothetical protein
MTLIDVHAVQPGEVAFSETEIVYGIQQIGFTQPVASTNPNNAFVKLELLMEIVFELVK